jgi:hypothetical protein
VGDAAGIGEALQAHFNHSYEPFLSRKRELPQSFDEAPISLLAPS